VQDAARRLGLYLRPLGDTVYVTPALDIDLDDLDRLLDGVEVALRACAP
jgi:adenosylmethionine-8-amino-7-oxononanoate aminotransferase